MEITLLKDFEQKSPNTTFPKGSKIIVGDSVAQRLGAEGYCDYEAAKATLEAQKAAAAELDKIAKKQSKQKTRKKV